MRALKANGVLNEPRALKQASRTSAADWNQILPERRALQSADVLRHIWLAARQPRRRNRATNMVPFNEGSTHVFGCQHRVRVAADDLRDP
jgi:hypothetical protein